ncbi:MAG: hypothetical protein QXZ30_02420, partial [Candidatus Bilamarchaeaceae archaeon]
MPNKLKKNFNPRDKNIKWNIFDWFLAKYRLSKIIKYLPHNAVVCDVGCGPNGSLLFSIRNK